MILVKKFIETFTFIFTYSEKGWESEDIRKSVTEFMDVFCLLQKLFINFKQSQ